jgi:hypothetical protein
LTGFLRLHEKAGKKRNQTYPPSHWQVNRTVRMCVPLYLSNTQTEKAEGHCSMRGTTDDSQLQLLGRDFTLRPFAVTITRALMDCATIRR